MKEVSTHNIVRDFEQSTKKLSILRLLIFILGISVVSYFSKVKVSNWQAIKSVSAQTPWFAAYVDATSTPFYPFEQLHSELNRNIVLSFIVSSTSDPCIPTWGTYHTLEEARSEIDLDRRIARLKQLNGNVAISFGGALNSELALNCRNHDSLINAYRSVIDRYQIDTIDLDLENNSLKDVEASTRRSKAISALQSEIRNKGKSLAIWLTLPVSPQGLTIEGTMAIKDMISQGVDLAGVNVMTMDYSSSRSENQSMYEASRQALIQTHRQLKILYQQSGNHLSDITLWRKIGATPMIGQNDIVNEIFSITDAKQLNEFARSVGLGRMSMWSANRDVQCGDNYVDVKVVSDSCSGVKNNKFEFTTALGANFTGDLSKNAAIVTPVESEILTQYVDNPATSPYQIWSETGTYIKGTKVAWHGNVYEAKWWTKADIPDNPVLQSWETPWQLIGPVLPGEKPIEKPTLPKGTYPEWSGVVIYNAGDRVLFESIPFQSKWWNQGESPAAATANADSSPWKPLTEAEIKQILETLPKPSPVPLKNKLIPVIIKTATSSSNLSP